MMYRNLVRCPKFRFIGWYTFQILKLNMVNDLMKVHLLNQKLRSAEVIFVPLIHDGHWWLMVVNMATRELLTFNSMAHADYTCKEVNESFLQWWKFYWEVWYKEDLDWSIRSCKVPQQEASSDCAMFVLHYMDAIANGSWKLDPSTANFDFGQHTIKPDKAILLYNMLTDSDNTAAKLCYCGVFFLFKNCVCFIWGIFVCSGFC